jgi:hypothetical protein
LSRVARRQLARGNQGIDATASDQHRVVLKDPPDRFDRQDPAGLYGEVGGGLVGHFYRLIIRRMPEP